MTTMEIKMKTAVKHPQNPSITFLSNNLVNNLIFFKFGSKLKTTVHNDRVAIPL